LREIDAGEGHEFDWDPSAGPMRPVDRSDRSESRSGIDRSCGSAFDAPSAFLRRPFSIAGREEIDGIPHVDLIGREVGVGTRFLSRLRVGDEVSLLGPLGNRFRLPGPNGIGLLVGGGVGIPPMIYLAQGIAELNRVEPEARPRRAIAFSGALTVDLLALTRTGNAPKPGPVDFDPRYNIAEFDAFGVPAVISTDDGSWGWKGYVTEALEKYLDAWITDQADRMRTIIYTCGPEPMMKRVQEIAARRGIACEIAVERAMACGMGTCQSCCIRVRKPDPARPPMPGESWCYRLACTDGPVFCGDDLLW
jgi:dihydroorotate dehydrogenase electron transfer subunit